MPAASYPELVGVFCDLFAAHAPEPDVRIQALMAAGAAPDPNGLAAAVALIGTTDVRNRPQPQSDQAATG